jgi:hypothetical protein
MGAQKNNGDAAQEVYPREGAQDGQPGDLLPATVRSACGPVNEVGNHRQRSGDGQGRPHREESTAATKTIPQAARLLGSAVEIMAAYPRKNVPKDASPSPHGTHRTHGLRVSRGSGAPNCTGP